MSVYLRRQRPSTLLPSPYFALLLFCVAMLPRMLAAGRYITPDELNWVHRSVLFHQAITNGQWAEMLTTGHPGVITTWLGAIGIQIQLWLRPSDWQIYEWITHLAWLAPENTAAFPQLATFLTAGRTAVAVANSLGLLTIFWLARRLVNIKLAAGFALLLAIDPFLAGLSGLLHVDGLLTTFVTISLLALAVMFGEQKKDWQFTAVSGVAAGCAILAKSAALTLLPFVGFAFLTGLVVWPQRRLRLVGLGLVWLLGLLVIQLLLLPTLWDAPVAVYQTIIGTILHETEEVLPRTFFMGVNRQAHGALFYPVALLYRLNPVVCIGFMLGGWYSLRRKLHAGWWKRPLIWLSIIWPIFFIIVLSLATKKYDRYLLPALPLLFFLGLMGWALLLENRPNWTRNATIAGTAIALVYLGTAVPYLLNAYNPLLGGVQTAKRVMPMGWGEAISASAQWLAEQPDAVGKTAVVGIAPAFAPYFPGETLLSGNGNRQRADFVVGTLATLQEDMFRYDPCLVPNLIHCIRYDGEIQAWIHANDHPERHDVVWEPIGTQFGDEIRIIQSGTFSQDDQLNVWVQWQLARPTNGRFNVQIRLLDGLGQEWSQVEMPLLNDVYFYPEHWRLDEQPIFAYPLALPPGLPPASYQLELSLFNAEGGVQLPVLAKDGRFAGVVQPLAELELSPPPLLQTESLQIVEADAHPLLNEKLIFLGTAELPENVLTAGSFSVDLFWQGTAVLPPDIKLQFFANESPLSRLPLSRFNSGRWEAGQVIHEKYHVVVPADLTAGEYALRVELVDEDGRQIENAPIQLGSIQIDSPDRLFTLPNDIDQPTMLQFGEIAALHGYDLATLQAAPDEPVQFTLYWQIDQPSAEIISTFVHLVGPDGRIITQGDQWPGGLPSTTWAAGQVIIDEYAILLPTDAPLGEYEIVIGLYSPDNGMRFPIFTSAGDPMTGDQFVLPLRFEVVAR